MDQGQKPKIVKALLDGTNRTTIVSTGIVAPVDITIDRLTDDVYWADSIVDTIQVGSYVYWLDSIVDTIQVGSDVYWIDSIVDR